MELDRASKNQDVMPKLDIKKDSGKLKPTDLVFMKRVEAQNLQRAVNVRGYRKANNITAITLGLCVIGIYSYTIYSVRQEKFLDDFNEPEKIIEKPM